MIDRFRSFGLGFLVGSSIGIIVMTILVIKSSPSSVVVPSDGLEVPSPSSAIASGHHWRFYKAIVTAYCGGSCCCGKWADDITASGHVIQKGDKFIAAQKNFSFGTVMNIPGYGEYKVEDRGGAIVDNRLDVYFDTHQEALNWGVKFLEVGVRHD